MKRPFDNDFELLGEGTTARVYLEGNKAVKRRKDNTCFALTAEAKALRRLVACSRFVQPISPRKTLPECLVFRYAGINIRGVRLPETAGGAITYAVLEALNFCHNKGIFHADVTPTNVLYNAAADPGEQIKLVDLGNCVTWRELPFRQETTSPAYCAPYRSPRFGCIGDERAMINGDMFSAALVFVATQTDFIENHTSARARLAYFEEAIGEFPAWYTDRRPVWFQGGRVAGCTPLHPAPFIPSSSSRPAVRAALTAMLSYDAAHAPADTAAFAAYPHASPIEWPV